MIGDATKLLKAVAKHGEIPMSNAIKMNSKQTGTHVDQFPLALLLESDYLGISISLGNNKNMERMKELETAIYLHIFNIPRNPDGSVKYMSITSSGNINPENERIFIKAKGLLYLEEKATRFRERIYSFAIGVLVGLIAVTFSAWVRGQLAIP